MRHALVEGVQQEGAGTDRLPQLAFTTANGVGVGVRAGQARLEKISGMLCPFEEGLAVVATSIQMRAGAT